MPVEIKGFQELIDTFNNTTKISNQTANRALKSAAEIVKKEEVKQAQKHDKYSKDIGWKEIKSYPIRSSKSLKVVSVGIKSQGQAFSKGDSRDRSTHWGKVRGLSSSPYMM